MDLDEYLGFPKTGVNAQIIKEINNPDYTGGLLTKNSVSQLLKLENRYASDPLISLAPKKENAIRKWYLDYLKLCEGNIPFIYLDSVGEFTIGIGHLIQVQKALKSNEDDKKKAMQESLKNGIQKLKGKGIKFKVDKTGKIEKKKINFQDLSFSECKEATNDEIDECTEGLVNFYHQKKKNNEINSKLIYFESYNQKSNYLVISKDDMEKIVSPDIDVAFQDVMRERLFPEFSDYPVGAQIALIDMSYNLGLKKFGEFRNFKAWIKGPQRVKITEK